MTILKLQNFKGSNETHELGKVNLLCGVSGAGKSAMIQALTFLTAGYLTDGTEVYKKPEEIFKLASADDMNVILTNDMGTFERGITRSVKVKLEGTEVKYSRTADVSNKFGEKTATQLADRITSDFGIHESVLNFPSFANLSAEEQKKFIFSIYPVDKEKWTKEAIVAYLSDKLVGNINETATEILEVVADMCVNASVNTATEHVKKKYNELNAQKGADEVKMQNLTEIRQRDTESVRGLAVAKQNQTIYTDRIGQLSEQLQKAITHNQQIRDSELRKTKLKEELEKLSSDLADKQNLLESHDNEIVELLNLKEELSKPQTLDDDVKRLNDQLLQIDASVQIAFEYKNNKADDLTECQNMCDEAEKAVIQAQSNVDQATNILNGIKTTFAKLSAFDGTCPLSCSVKCNTDMSPVIQELEQDIERNRLLVVELETQRDLAKARFDGLVKGYQDFLEPEYEKACEEYNNHFEFYAQKKAEYDVAVANMLENASKVTNELARLTTLISNIQTQDTIINSEIKVLETKTTDCIDEIADLEANVKMPIDVELIQTDIDVLKQHLKDVNEQIEEKVKAKTNLENLANLEEEAAKTLAQWQTYKLVREALGSKGLAGQMIIEAINPMVSGIQHNLDTLMGGVEFYVDTDNFNFGWKSSKGKCSYETLSGGETLILTTAMLIEFMQKTCRYKLLLIDNINHTDVELSKRFVSGVVALKDKYDLCVMALNHGGYEETDGLNVIKL